MVCGGKHIGMMSFSLSKVGDYEVIQSSCLQAIIDEIDRDMRLMPVY